MFGDSIVFWHVMSGELSFHSGGLQMMCELIGQILPPTIRMKLFYYFAMLCLQPGFELEVSVECLRFSMHQADLCVACMIISE